jgi:hypothetical protein
VRIRQHHSGTPHSEEDTHEYEEDITFEVKGSYHGEAVEQVRTMFEKLLKPVLPDGKPSDR